MNSRTNLLVFTRFLQGFVLVQSLITGSAGAQQMSSDRSTGAQTQPLPYQRSSSYRQLSNDLPVQPPQRPMHLAVSTHETMLFIPDDATNDSTKTVTGNSQGQIRQGSDKLVFKEGDKSSAGDEAERQKKEAALQQRNQRIETGRTAFQNRCVACHDADKSLLKSKNLNSWRATVSRMARQDGADIPESDWEPIALFLASKDGNGNLNSDDGNPVTEADDLTFSGDSGPSEVTVFGTVSPTFRTHGTEIQNPGFMGDVWAGVAWEPSNGPVSAKMVACISCHNEHDEGYLSRIEIVQASLTLNLGQVLRGEAGVNTKKRQQGNCTGASELTCLPQSQFSAGDATKQVEAFIEAGRFVVPFGAFSSQVNPGVYRTVSRPLMYNMGQRVFDENLGDPVLPMPYSDEGADLNLVVPLLDNIDLNIDAYVVNGLQGGNSINFDDSRDYVDNNRAPAVGGRVTLGNSTLRLGSSIIAGQFNGVDGTGPDNKRLDFMIYGADATFRYQDILRVQAEFAQRDTKAYYDFAAPLYATDKVGGWFAESELLLSRAAHVSALCRWDNQRQQYGAFDPAGELPAQAFSVNRLTYGLNWTLPGGSLFMFNMEHWYLPNGYHDMNVVGARWAASF